MQNHTESVYLKLALTYIYKNNNKNDCLYVHLAIKDNVKKSYYKTNGLKYIKKKKKTEANLENLYTTSVISSCLISCQLHDSFML
jgi:hypothetical protein